MTSNRKDELDDNRPCSTDLFLAHLFKHEKNHYDFYSRISDWLHGDWANALDLLPLMSAADLVYLRDLDGTGLMHACSDDAPGAVEYAPTGRG